MQSWSLLAVLCLLAAGCALLVGERALADARDLAALYWLATGALALRATLAMARS